MFAIQDSLIKILLFKITQNLTGASVIVTCLDWVGNEATGRITCLMDNEKIPIHGTDNFLIAIDAF